MKCVLLLFHSNGVRSEERPLSFWTNLLPQMIFFQKIHLRDIKFRQMGQKDSLKSESWGQRSVAKQSFCFSVYSKLLLYDLLFKLVPERVGKENAQCVYSWTSLSMTEHTLLAWQAFHINTPPSLSWLPVNILICVLSDWVNVFLPIFLRS